jgi:hypothetical protein
MLGIEGRVRIA